MADIGHTSSTSPLSGRITIVASAGSPRIEVPQADVEQRVRDNMRFEVQNRIQRMFFWVSIVSSFAQIIPIVIVLVLSWKQECEGALRQFLIIYGSLILLHVTATVYHRINPPPALINYDAFTQPPTQMGRFMLSLTRAVDLSLLLTFMFGALNLSLSTACKGTSPMLYWTSVAIVIFNIFQVLLPMLLFISAICCLPCIMVFVQRFHPEPNRGATEEAINAVPKFKYQVDTAKQNYNGVTIEPDDAKCSICLQPYTPNVGIRVLRCKHHFHLQCADDWFHISATCPLCVRPIDPNSPANNTNNNV